MLRAVIASASRRMRFLQILTGCRPSRWLPVERLDYVEARVVEILQAHLHPEDHWYVARSDAERDERAMRFIVWRYGIGYDLSTGGWSVERPYRAAADDRPARPEAPAAKDEQEPTAKGVRLERLLHLISSARWTWARMGESVPSVACERMSQR